MSTTEESVILDDIKGGFHRVNTSEERVVAATQVAYDELIEFIGGIKENFSPGKINYAKSGIIDNQGTQFKINFEIFYVPTGNTMNCVAVVLENSKKAFEVKNVSCECCNEEDDSKITNVRSNKYIIVI